MILDKIVNIKKVSIEERKRRRPLEEIKKEAMRLVGYGNENTFRETLKKPGLSIIGEFKKASPSKGVIVNDFNIEEIEKYYENLGVDAYSVLTEENFFLGSDDNLRKVKSLSKNPILRKDFVIDFYQLYEAKILGASAVLLIVSSLGENLKEFYLECKKLHLDALIEVHNKEELDIALRCGGEIIGINNRDLKTFNTTLDTTKNLISYIPKDKIIVSESGLNSIEDLKKVEEYGSDAVLIGEMFMRNIGNKEFIKEFKNR